MIKLGIDLINNNLDLFKNKRVGLITNPTGIDSNFESTIDVLNNKVNLVALFSPEHGIRGSLQAGVNLGTYVDDKTGITVFSLYGSTRRPSKEMLDNIDILCIDIQDVGSRFYTYIYTMAYAMQACKEYNKEFVVFDRPNPCNAKDFEGNILDLKYRSFVGYYPILQRHGLTIGELSKLFNEEFEINCKLHVIKMENYNRSLYFEDTKKLWVLPSPNIPTPSSTIVYNCTCIFEGTNVSEGRGTTTPFEIVGAPYIDPEKLSEKMNYFNFKGVYFRPQYFTPTFSKHKDVLCGGVFLHILNRNEFTPVKVGWTMLEVIRTMYSANFQVNSPYREGGNTMLEYNTGTNKIKNHELSLKEQMTIIDNDTNEFAKIRNKYLLY